MTIFRRYPLVLALLCLPLVALSPQLSSGVKLCSPCSSPWPCQSSQACAANVGAQILYNSNTSVNRCPQVWSMNASGGNKINLSSLIFANGFAPAGPTLSQGTPTYSPNGLWMIWPSQVAGSVFACTAHAVAPGAATDFQINACDTATYANCTILRTVATHVGHGALHPQLTRDGSTLYWGFWLGTVGHTSEGNSGSFQWATFTPGTPPTIGTVHESDFAGDGTKTLNWYEPADSDGAIGTTTCWVYLTTSRTAGSTSYADVGIARFSLGSAVPGCPAQGTYNFVTTPFEGPTGCYSEFWSLNQRLDTALTISSCFFTGRPSPPSVLDLVEAQASSGAGAQALTGFNLAGTPEYAYPALVSNPHQGFDGSYVVFNLVTNASLQGQGGGFGGATGSSIWKYTVVLVPVQITGATSMTGQAEYQ